MAFDSSFLLSVAPSFLALLTNIMNVFCLRSTI